MGLPDIDNIPDTGAVFTIGRSRFADNIASHFFIRKDPVVSVTCGDEHSAVVCQSGRLFVFGSNDWGQLGLGHKNHVSKPSCVKILKPEKVTHVACGRAHTLICTAEQKIFACGSDQESQLGRGSQAIGDSSSSPIMVYDCGIVGAKLMQISAGSHHSLALLQDGTVLAWGSNLEGQLGLPGTSGLVNKPTKVHIPETVKQISAGYYHSAFLTESGNVYVCGEAESGKLGIPLDFSTQAAPKQMQLSGPAAFVACGGHHTLVLGEDGNIYCTGSNSSGQLSMGLDVTEIPTPKMLQSLPLRDEIVKKIGCGESHVAIVTESGKLFTCGDGRHGKLGLEENENNVHELTLATKYLELEVSDVACGGCHTILVGRRREPENELENADEEESGMTMKNPLPPLKIPLSRIACDSTSLEKPEQMKTIAQTENNANEEMMESEGKTMENMMTNDGPETIVNAIDKPESPKKLADYEETISKVSSISDDKNDDNDKISENNNDESAVKKSVDAENNTTEKNEEIERATSAKSKTDSLNSRESRVTIEEQEKSSSAIDAEPETMKKPCSPPLPVPPPKPPRQKIDSGENSQSSRQGSSSSRLGSTGSCEKKLETKHEETMNTELPIETEEIKAMEEEIAKSEEDSMKKSASSEKSRSVKSRTGTDETAEADGQNILDDIEDDIITVKEDARKILQDDMDVVQSPITRTGKMAKLFRTKKQEVENGTKTNSTGDTKAKSKTCVIL